MTVTAVVFDWGGTLTPYHQVDLLDLWKAAAKVLAPARADEVALALMQAERAWWRRTAEAGGHKSGTTHDVLEAAFEATGLDVETALLGNALDAHLEAWTPHTLTDPEAEPLLYALRERGIRTGVLSNTHWPREWHERWLERDGVLDLIDARVYTSDLAHTKPHPEAFKAVLGELGVDDPATAVMVGDRPFDDIAGGRSVGMRTVLLGGPSAGGHVPRHDVEPDAVIERLGELLGCVDAWR